MSLLTELKGVARETRCYKYLAPSGAERLSRSQCRNSLNKSIIWVLVVWQLNRKEVTGGKDGIRGLFRFVGPPHPRIASPRCFAEGRRTDHRIREQTRRLMLVSGNVGSKSLLTESKYDFRSFAPTRCLYADCSAPVTGPTVSL